MNLHEIKDQFMLNKDSDDTLKIVAEEAIKLTGICGGLTMELVGEWEKLKKRNLDTYPIGLEAKSALIAHFMGWKEMSYTKSKDWMLTEMIEGMECARKQKSLKDMKFHSSWNWFMPVANQCFQMINKQNRPSVNHCSNLVWIEHNISMAIREYSLAAAFEFAVDFVIYFNINNNQ